MEQRVIPLARALADDTRLRILEALGGADELSCGELVERCEVGQSTVSHHLKTLCDCGLVAIRQVGQRSQYRLRPTPLRELAATIAALARDHVARPSSHATGRHAPERGLPDLGSGNVD